MANDNVTLGEVHRICERIEAQVLLQNGRIRKLEDDGIRLKSFWTVAVIVAGPVYEWAKHKLGF